MLVQFYPFRLPIQFFNISFAILAYIHDLLGLSACLIQIGRAHV